MPEGAPAPDRPRDEFLRHYGAWFDPIPAMIESTDLDAVRHVFGSMGRTRHCATHAVVSARSLQI
jgi:hypothetical protein